MSMDRSLATLLRSLQFTSPEQDAHSLLPSATTLLSSLSNPLNVTLLASQLLSAPAIWDRHLDLITSRRILSVFHTSAAHLLQHEQQDAPTPQYPLPRGLSKNDWVKAVVNGADEKSPRWRHLLLIGGALLGFEGQKRQGLPAHLRVKLESALVRATNLALRETPPQDLIGLYSVVLALNHTFELLSDAERAQLDYDSLLPLLLDATFFSAEGLESGYYLGIIDRDVVQISGKKFSWSPKSSTFLRTRHISSKPLIASLGPLSRLIAHSVENVKDAGLVSAVMDRLSEFARTMTVQWRQNKLSEIDASEESVFLDEESLKISLPVLWQLLRVSMFAVVIVLRAALGRLLGDPVLAADNSAPYVSMQCLHTLRNLHFISSRLGQHSSSQYTFTNLTAIDVLAQYPENAASFLKSIRPAETGQIPHHPVERSLDLFFLNTIEHFTLVLSPEVNEDLAIAAVLPYLAAGGNNYLLEIFEAAHSVMLAVLAAPQSAHLASKHMPFYVDALFKVFPQNLSARQFRLAYKTVVRITAPPSPLAHRQPLLPSILLDLIHDRALHASSKALPSAPPTPDQHDPDNGLSLSEQAVLILTLIDSLCFLPVQALEEWLPLTASLVNKIDDPDMRRACQERFWESMSSGEMDVERAALCVAWWGTRGGREAVMFGRTEGQDMALMSGGLGMESKM